MIKATVSYNGKQILLNLPDNPKSESIQKYLYEVLPKTIDLQRHVIQLFDPNIGEYFDLNEDGLRSWLSLPMKDKLQMNLQIVRATINTNQQENPHDHDSMSIVFKKIQDDIDVLFSTIQNLQQTANGIRNDFQSAFEKYQMSKIQRAPAAPIPERTNFRNELKERIVHFPVEDVRFLNSSQIKPTTTVPLVSDAYREDDDEDESDQETLQTPAISFTDIDIPLLNVGEDFQALVSIAVNPSYFFIQNTFYTQDLERLAQKMNEYYSTVDTPTDSFRPAEMSCCAARYSVDDRWYRARVKRYNSDDLVEIVYLDYGNNEERSIHELKPLDPAFTRLPAQAICVALELLPAGSTNLSSWSKTASCKIYEDTLAKPIDVRITAQPTLQWPMYFVQVTIDEHTDMAETLLSLGLARRASFNEIIRTVGPRLDLSDYAAYNLPKQIDKLINRSSIKKPTVNAIKPATVGSLSKRIHRSNNVTIPELNFHFNDHISSCTVTSIISPTHFFIQLIEKNQFDQLYTELHETYLQRISSDRIQRLKSYSINSIGVARNQRDQRFYRVQIISHEREKKSLTVLCFDVGEYLTVQDSSIYELLPEYQSFPAQAIKCSLGLIRPVLEDWSRESINYIHRLMGGKAYKIFRFYSLGPTSGNIKITDSAMPIVIFDTNNPTNSINEQLIEKKFAVADPNFLELIRIVHEGMNDVNGFKNQRIRQYIESQRNFKDTIEPTPSAVGPSLINDDDENAPFCPPVVDPELRHWYAVEVTHVKTPGEFFIRFPFGIDNTLGQGREPAPFPEQIEPNQMLNDLHRNMTDFYATEQRRGISTAMTVDRGQMVAVRYQSQWYRARVLEFKAATNFAWVQFVDQGDTRELGTNTMRVLHPKFLDLPLQAYSCQLDGFDPDYSWSSHTKDLFKKKIRDKFVYAKKIREPNVIQLLDKVDQEFVSFESLWKTLNQPTQKSNLPNVMNIPITKIQDPIENLQPLMNGLVNYASGSEQSQVSPTRAKPSKVKISNLSNPSTSSIIRPTMQFVSAGFKQPTEYSHLSPDEQLKQFQRQESHRINSTNTFAINRNFRSQN